MSVTVCYTVIIYIFYFSVFRLAEFYRNIIVYILIIASFVGLFIMVGMKLIEMRSMQKV